MNTKLNRNSPRVAFRAVMQTCACLFWSFQLSSCGDKKQDVDPKKKAPSSPVNRMDVPINLQPKISLEDFTKEIKKHGGDWTYRQQAVETVMELGRKKQVSAVPSLLDGMLIIQPFSTNNAADIQETYPCSAALVLIGEPAVPEIQKRFLASASKVEQLILLETLIFIKGPALVAEWVGGIAGNNGNAALPEKRLDELKQWVLSHDH